MYKDNYFFIFVNIYNTFNLSYIDMENINDMLVFNNFDKQFSNINDPRQEHKVTHLLSEILFTSVLAVIAGCEDFEEIERYAKEKQPWLSTFLSLPGGIPSHDTYNRVLCAINPVEFEQNFVSWVSDYFNLLPTCPDDEKDVVPIDGKTLCNSINKRKGSKAIHMVSALSTKHGLILGQQKCNEKSNEITAIPLLLGMINIKDSIVTIDAMGCQKNIASKIISGKADYILALKGNQGNLSKEVVDFFEKVQRPEFKHYIHDQYIEDDKGHGRIEQRECTTVTNLDWLLETEKWESISCIVKITSKVFKDQKETIEERYYISSLKGNANQINRAIRKHWHVENKLHWVLDVTFNEDDCRVRNGHGAENLSVIRRIALNKLKCDKSQKASLKVKRKMAGWNDDYALKIFSEMMLDKK